MSHNLYDAHHQWCNLPPGQLFSDLEGLLHTPSS